MSNPFDQFTSDFQAALPPQPAYGAPMQQPQPGMMSAAAPAPPVYGSGYGAPSPYGAPPPAAMPPYGGDMTSQPPPYGAPPGPYGAPPTMPPQQPQGLPPTASPMAPAPPAPFGGYGAPPSSIAGPPSTPIKSPEAFSVDPTETLSQAPNPFGAPGQVGAGIPGSGPNLGVPPTQPPMPPAPPAPYADPWGSPVQSAPPSQPPPAQPSYGAYGAPPPTYPGPPMPPADPAAGALVISQTQSNPYAQYGVQPPPPTQYPYGQPQPPPQQHQQPLPYGQQQMTPYGQPYGASAPPPASMDPFSVFEAQSRAPEPPSQALVPVTAAAPLVAATDEDFWGSFSANAPAPAAPEPAPVDVAPSKVADEKKTEDGLPPGGEWYDARIFTPTLGVMFFKPQELTDSLFLNTDPSMVDALADRPVVAFIVEGSSARSAGVELGHVLLKVNGVDVKNPKDASRLIKEGPRPLPLLFYVPNTEVVTAEGEHMVKYDTRETTAPNSAKDWKPKYVVIGGIIAQPWMMNMYRSKSEYDIAVIETQARRPVSVKVKQFSLQGARIQNDWQGPQMVKYKNKLHPWKYIVVLPVARNPIKISSPNLASLKPVHEGIRRVLLAQQRGRDYNSQQSAAPSRDGRETDYDREPGRDSYRSASSGGGGDQGYDDRSYNTSRASQGGGESYSRNQNGYDGPPAPRSSQPPPPQQQQQYPPAQPPSPQYHQGYPPQSYPPMPQQAGYPPMPQQQQPVYRY